MNWNQSFASRTGEMRRSTVREVLKLAVRPDMISFGGGLPAPELFPVEEVRQATEAVLRRHPERALQYGETEGIAELRDSIARSCSRPGLPVRRENVLIVTGSQQALDLVGRVLLDPGDAVLVENPTYLAALGAWRPLGARFRLLPSDGEGMQVSALPAVPPSKTKLLYCIPNFQNPTGATLSLERRRALVAWSQSTGVPILEDDPYGELRYEGDVLPSLLELSAALAATETLTGGVIHLGTFSKTLAPGLRVGWVVAPEPVIEKLTLAKQSADLHTSTLCQFVVLELVRAGVLARHLPRLRAAYRMRRDAMRIALREHFPADVTWTEPAGGLFLFVKLPERINAAELLPLALARGVAFVPGEDFHANGGGQNTLRLNFSNASPERIMEGIRRLAAVVAG